LLSEYKLNLIINIIYGKNYKLIKEKNNYYIKNKKFDINFDFIINNKLNEKVIKEIEVYIKETKIKLNDKKNIKKLNDKDILEYIIILNKELEKLNKENDEILKKISYKLFPNSKIEKKTNYYLIKTKKEEIKFNPLTNEEQLKKMIFQKLPDFEIKKQKEYFIGNIKNKEYKDKNINKLIIKMLLQE